MVLVDVDVVVVAIGGVEVTGHHVKDARNVAMFQPLDKSYIR